MGIFEQKQVESDTGDAAVKFNKDTPKLAIFESRDTVSNSSFLLSTFNFAGVKITLKKPHPSLVSLKHMVWSCYIWVSGENQKVFICFRGIWLLLRSLPSKLLRWLVIFGTGSHFAWNLTDWNLTGSVHLTRQAHYASFLVGVHRKQQSHNPWFQGLNMFEQVQVSEYFDSPTLFRMLDIACLRFLPVKGEGWNPLVKIDDNLGKGWWRYLIHIVKGVHDIIQYSVPQDDVS